LIIRILILFYFLSLQFVSVGQYLIETYYPGEDSLLKEKFHGIINSPDTFKNGNYSIYYKSGAVFQEGSYVNNLLQGEWRIYYENSNLKSIINFNKSKRSGPFTHFYESGTIQQVGKYYNNYPHGKIITYYPSGNKKISGEYLKGILNGQLITYSEDGIIEEVFTYKNNSVNGIYEKLL
jgi:antitoxin component YwqK of YwqJK toxin-antitoxin module